MKIHEYQAKAILAKHGVPVPQGEVILNADEAREAAKRLGGGVVVVKAQIHAGGRGKGEPDTGTNHLGFRAVKEAKATQSIGPGHDKR